MLFDAIGFYLQRVPYHIDMFLFISLLTKSGYSYSLQCHYNKTIPAAGLLFLITRFSTFQILLSETYFLRVLTEVFVSVIYKQQKKRASGRRGNPWLIVPVACCEYSKENFQSTCEWEQCPHSRWL